MGLNKVGLYYISFNLYTLSTGLIGVFLNLFVLATTSLAGVIYFNIFYMGGVEILYLATVYALNYLEPKDLYVIGAAIRALTLIFLITAAAFVSNLLVFGFLYGASIGTFWLGNNILTSDLSKKMDRTDFVYKNSVIGGAMSFIAPTIAGIMIQYSQFAGPLRFVYVFAAAIITLLASSYILSTIKMPKESRTIKFGLRHPRIKYSGYGYFKAYYMSYSMFSIVFTILPPVYIFLITSSYVITGIYGSTILLLGLFSNYLTKIEHRHWRAFAMAGIAASILSSIPLFFPGHISALTAIFVFTIVYTIFSTPLNNQASSNFLELIDRSGINRIYFWINREYYIASGRAAAFLALVLVSIYFGSEIIYLVYLIPFMSLYNLIYLKSSKKAPPQNAVTLQPNELAPEA